MRTTARTASMVGGFLQGTATVSMTTVASSLDVTAAPTEQTTTALATRKQVCLSKQAPSPITNHHYHPPTPPPPITNYHYQPPAPLSTTTTNPLLCFFFSRTIARPHLCWHNLAFFSAGSKSAHCLLVHLASPSLALSFSFSFWHSLSLSPSLALSLSLSFTLTLALALSHSHSHTAPLCSHNASRVLGQVTLIARQLQTAQCRRRGSCTTTRTTPLWATRHSPAVFPSTMPLLQPRLVGVAQSLGARLCQCRLTMNSLPLQSRFWGWTDTQVTLRAEPVSRLTLLLGCWRALTYELDAFASHKPGANPVPDRWAAFVTMDLAFG
jgi:hypothetical protein